MHKGYCYAYRGAWSHPAFNDLREAAIWNFLYQNAFYEDGERNFNKHTFQLKRGQIVVSYSFLAKGFGMSDKGVRVVIQKLQKLGMLGIQGTSKGTILTICNYNEYQENKKTKGKQGGNQGANEGQAKGNNNKESINKEKEVIKVFDVFWDLYPSQRKGDKQKSFTAYQRALKKDTHENIMDGLKSYVRSDEVAKGFAKGCAAWLNDSRWLNEYEPAQKSIIEKELERSKSGGFIC